MWIDHRKEIRIFLAYESLYGGLMSDYQPMQLIKPNFLPNKSQIVLKYCPPTQYHSFFRNLPLYYHLGN